MKDFSLSEMQAVQRELQEKYKGKWPPLTPETGEEKLLYLFLETGEVGNIIQKQEASKIMGDTEVRHDFVEELCDVLMYLNELMLCYSVEPEELRDAYLKKHKRNLERW